MRYLALFLTLLAMPAQATPEQILARMQGFATAYNIGDPLAIAQFYSPSAALFPPGARQILGRPDITDHYRQAFSQGVGNLRFQILEVTFPAPETAIEIGETQVTVGQTRIIGRYIHVWQQSDGEWFLMRDFYHVLGQAPVE